MSNGKIFYQNLIHDCEVTASTSATGFGVEYIGNNNQGVVWRSTGITGETIDMTFAQATPLKGIIVMNHNFSGDDTVILQSSDDAFATIAETETVSKTSGLAEVNWNRRYYRLTMTRTTGEYIQVGEIYLQGAAYEFERNYHWNYAYVREINRNATQTTSGQVYRKTRFIRKGFNLEFSGINDTQKDFFEEISENDYICFLPKGDAGDLYYGYIDFSDFTHVYTDYWNVNATFMENPK